MVEFQSFLVQDLHVGQSATVTSLEQAIEFIRKELKPLGAERVHLRNSLNRVLREDVISDVNMPPFDKSAVDGYACRQKDIGNPLSVVETIPAGIQPRRKIGLNECAKIMTGAVMPAGADCVLLREDTEEKDGLIHFKRTTTPANICYKGEDVTVGKNLATSGKRISPSLAATLALAGYNRPLVSRKPGVGIIATGDEIVEPSRRPPRSKIRNSNSYQLIAHCEQFGCEARYYGIVKDTESAIYRAIRKARRQNEVLLLTGGVSAGDLDLVPHLLEKSGFKILAHGVGIQPGRPVIFGASKKQYVFGIPGSPVASFIVFEVLVKELLAGMMGLESFVRTSLCTLACDIKRQKANRIGWRPVAVSADGKALPVEYHGTAHISSYAVADGIIALPIGVTELKEGSTVEVRIV